jgi:hypothetical protein
MLYCNEVISVYSICIHLVIARDIHLRGDFALAQTEDLYKRDDYFQLQLLRDNRTVKMREGESISH